MTQTGCHGGSTHTLLPVHTPAQDSLSLHGRLHSLEHGDEQVEQQDVGKEQIEAEQGDRQPLGESGCLPCPVTLGTLGLVGVCAIGAALVHAEVHTCEEWAGQPENRKSVSRNWLPGTLAVGALRVPIGSDIPRVRDWVSG